MKLVDTHAHLCAEAFVADGDEVLARAREAGVSWVLNVADTLPTAQACVAWAQRAPGLYASAGVHPHEAALWTDVAADELRALCSDAHVVAVGEIGLDYHYDFQPRELQREVFLAQLQIAQAVGLPVIVHSREAEADTLAVLDQAPGVRGVLHCFWSDMATASALLERGFFLGVGGAITFGSAGDLRAVIQQVPLERLVLETDSPYLAPRPWRGRRNEPAYVVKVAEALAELHNRSVEYVARQTGENAAALFQVP